MWRFGADRPRLLVLAHVDTVFADGVALEFRREGGELVGPGIGDNAAAVMAVVWTLEQLEDPPAGLAVAFTVGEEGLGDLRGARVVCAELEPEAVIALEGHGLDEVMIDHVGSERARLIVTGPGGHSWWDRGTPSAVHGAGRARRRPDRRRRRTSGSISGGDAVNAIAGPGGGCWWSGARSIRRSLRGSRPGWMYSRSSRRWSWRSSASAGALRAARRADHPLVTAVRGQRLGLGLPDRLGSGSTDANAAVALGIPAVALGCARGSGMHSTGERIDLRSLEFGCVQALEMMRALGT